MRLLHLHQAKPHCLAPKARSRFFRGARLLLREVDFAPAALLIAGCAMVGGCAPQIASEAEDPSSSRAPEKLQSDLKLMTQRVTLLEEERRQLLVELERSRAEGCPVRDGAAHDGAVKDGVVQDGVREAGIAHAQEAERPSAEIPAELPVVKLEAPEGVAGELEELGPTAEAAKTPPLSEMAPLLLSGAADAGLYDRGAEALSRGEHFQAEGLLSRFIEENPRHPFVDDALVLRGEARRLSRRPALAMKDFLIVVQRYPDEMRTPDAWLGLGRVHAELGDPSSARDAFLQLSSRFPESPAAMEVPQEYRQ